MYSDGPSYWFQGGIRTCDLLVTVEANEALCSIYVKQYNLRQPAFQQSKDSYPWEIRSGAIAQCVDQTSGLK